MESNTLQLIFYRTDDEHKNSDIERLCNGDTKQIRNTPWISDVGLEKIKTVDDGKGSFTDPVLRLNGTYYSHKALIQRRYTVRTAGLIHMDLVLCSVEYSQGERRLTASRSPLTLLPSSSSSSPSLSLEGGDVHELREAMAHDNYVASIEGSISFRNPYGFLPAEYFGLLPFEAARTLLYAALLVWYVAMYRRHKESVLHLHSALLAVVVLATVESAVWCATYLQLNQTGQRFCCPYPPLVIASLLLQLIRQTCARTLLLVVSLGYGIVRPRLLSQEWLAIALVTIFYFFAAAAQQINLIVLGNVRRRSSTDQPVSSTDSKSTALLLVPEFVMDVIFLSWTYLAISSTIRILSQFRQTEKLKIYESLISIIGVFVLLFALISIVFVLDDWGRLSWPWQLTWLQQAIWELLNLSVLVAIALVTRPHENSRVLAYASQLPTDDFDGPGELEMTSHGYGPDDNDSDEDEQVIDLQSQSQYNPISRRDYDMVSQLSLSYPLHPSSPLILALSLSLSLCVAPLISSHLIPLRPLLFLSPSSSFSHLHLSYLTVLVIGRSGRSDSR